MVESLAVNTATMHVQSMLAKLWVSDEKQVVLLAGFQDKSELWLILTN